MEHFSCAHIQWKTTVHMKNLVTSLFQPVKNFIKYFHGNFLWHSTPNREIVILCSRLNIQFNFRHMSIIMPVLRLVLRLSHEVTDSGNNLAATWPYKKRKTKNKWKSLCYWDICLHLLQWTAQLMVRFWLKDSEHPFHLIICLSLTLHCRWILAVFHGLNAHLEAECISLMIQTHSWLH